MQLIPRLVVTAIKIGTSILCRIDRRDLHKVPAHGPLIVVSNHIGSLEVPLIFAQLQPRKMIGLAKIETWNSRFMAWLFDSWEAIPIRRGEVDLDAVRACLEVLKAGDILGVAPEGTRSYHGNLLRGQPGIALIALRSGAPILPVVHWGAEDYPANFKRLNRTDFHIRVGRPFVLDARGEKVTGEVRQAMADEIMIQMAALMPEKYHGEYAGRDPAACRYIKFVSN